MANVLTEQIRREDFKRLVLFGHSGGGVLAVLLAERLPQTVVVVSMAANLDIDAWTDLHGYSRLSRSLNPSAEVSLDPSIAQLHLVGGKDTNVPYSILQPYLQRQTNPQALVLPEYDHACCWQELWPDVLEWVSRAESSPTGQRVPRFLTH